MGSEFAYEDISSQEVAKYTYKYIKEEKILQLLDELEQHSWALKFTPDAFLLYRDLAGNQQRILDNYPQLSLKSLRLLHRMAC